MLFNRAHSSAWTVPCGKISPAFDYLLLLVLFQAGISSSGPELLHTGSELLFNIFAASSSDIQGLFFLSPSFLLRPPQIHNAHCVSPPLLPLHSTMVTTACSATAGAEFEGARAAFDGFGAGALTARRLPFLLT